MNILILANNSSGLYRFRKELLETLIEKKYNVFLSIPKDDFVSEMQQMGCGIIETDVSRRGKNPFADLKLLAKYIYIIKSLKADVVFTYTIKPNVYGGIACQFCRVPYIVNMTGLGTAVENGGILQKITLALYKIGLRKAKKVFFQNLENLEFAVQHKIVRNNYTHIPGSGVNLTRFSPLPYPAEDDGIHFLFISRIMYEKGIEQYIDAAIAIKQKNPKVVFHVCGFCEKEYQGRLMESVDKGFVVWHGPIRDIRDMLKVTHCTIHPSFYPEGLSNVLLESCACTRPIITTDRSGCREVVDDCVNGFVVKQRDSGDLIEKIEKFLALPHEKKMQMGLAGRAKVEKEFNRQIVVDAYLKELENAK